MGLSAAVDYIKSLGIKKISDYLIELRAYAIDSLQALAFIKILDFENAGPVISFNVDDVHPHDVSSILDASDIGIRAGHHCAQPLMKFLKSTSTCRISFQIYNTKEDVDKLIEELGKVRRWLGYES
jgi:cysteine desulfurase/selenocysteine lyase